MVTEQRNPLPRLAPQAALGKAFDRLNAERRYRTLERQLRSTEWSHVAEKYASSGFGYAKYLDLDVYLRRDLRRAVSLARRLGVPNRGAVLDLGSGMGFFPYACNALGLRCYGVEPKGDWEYAEMFVESNAAMGVSTLDHMIRPGEPIPVPASWAPLAAITANQIQFNKTGRPDRAPEVLPSERFGVEEWDFLLRDLYSQAGNPSLFVQLSFNRPKSWTVPYTDELRDYFESLGGTCRGSLVEIPRLSFATVV